MRRITVALVDDQPIVRSGLRVTLAQDPQIEIVGEAQHGVEGVQMARLLRPDVVLMDIDMPRMGGVEATRQICNELQNPRPRVLILTVYQQDEYLFEALRAGASGFLLKTAPTEKVVEAIRAVAEGSAMLAPEATAKLITEFASRPAASGINAPELVTFTDRELDVFKLLVCGYRNDEIARRLVVGDSTVKSHIQHIYLKLGVRDRVQVVIYAYEHGLIQAGVGLVSADRWKR
ncbi:DNA-binding response regulator [Actinoplanes sp. NBRC 14428]|uniref:LuxR family two component transcriptional regulator n=1 Tax=Pseudosporangium ferrugineum TaxID=439699 RepID=A0A2T0RX70_9ACTN|nr:response regulator transcription factor [Pseudosporangium ferrugineum]PRY25789.1 LuxR family two component transcriptional regulator [Pseudosporangium ferrugineum]BCJ56161.1 DNA-binding response regulator [Actinoplanes sp. NBRC 14428]